VLSRQVEEEIEVGDETNVRIISRFRFGQRFGLVRRDLGWLSLRNLFRLLLPAGGVLVLSELGCRRVVGRGSVIERVASGPECLRGLLLVILLRSRLLVRELGLHNLAFLVLKPRIVFELAFVVVFLLFEVPPDLL